MVLNTDLKEIMMDHALRTISYIADIGDLVVLMARRRFVPQDIDDAPKPNRTPKMICHVFESDEAQFIAQSIGQAFQVAYMEFLKANGIEDHRFVKEMDYQEVLNSQEIFGDELEIFAKKELQKEVVVPKAKGEILGVVIVESGWGSMLPTVVIANLMSSGAAARCGQLNIGDQLIAINGLSLVGLPLSTCQTYIKNTKNQTVVKFTVVPCAPVVEVKIKRPETKYQLGFSVQNGVVSNKIIFIDRVQDISYVIYQSVFPFLPCRSAACCAAALRSAEACEWDIASLRSTIRALWRCHTRRSSICWPRRLAR